MALHATLSPCPADFEVGEVRFLDRMNQPFELWVRGLSTAPAHDLKALLGHRVTLSLPDEPLLSAVHGIVISVGRGAPEPGGATAYDMRIAPSEWVLTKRVNSRIFQKQTATAILEAILREHPVTAKPAVFTRPLAEREYCVQYDESDSDFAHRLLAEEGIAAYVDQAAGGRWTLVDDTTLQKPPVDPDLLVHANSSNLKPGALAVLGWRFEQRIAPVAAAIRDHDLRRPLLSLEHATAPFEATSPAEANLEVYTYEPDRLLRPGDDGGETRRDLEGRRAETETVELTANFAAHAGMSLRIEGEDLSGDWLVIQAEAHLRSAGGSGDSAQTTRQFKLIAAPLQRPFRPEHRKRPLLFGAQSARVVGATPEGTVDVDEMGRVNVELRWDRRDLWARGAQGRENPTRRVRVAQAWAGPGYGIVTLPRVGDEVLIAYEDGNPDRPLVIGRVHNAVSRTPLDLPEEHKTLSIWKSQSFGPSGPVDGYNVIYMDDAAGGEMLALKAQKDMGVVVANDRTTKIGQDDTWSVDRNQTVTVKGSQSVQVGGQSVGAGHQSTRLGGNYSLECKQADILSDAMRITAMNGNLELTASGERVDRSGTKHHFESPAIFMKTYDVVQVVTPRFHVFAGDEIHLQVGGSSVHITAGGIEITSSGEVKINGSTVKLNC